MKKLSAMFLMVAVSLVFMTGANGETKKDDSFPAGSCESCIDNYCSDQVWSCHKTDGCQEVLQCFQKCSDISKGTCVNKCVAGKKEAGKLAKEVLSCTLDKCHNACTR
jgi:hypothetical protein